MEKHEDTICVGIDLGTSRSSISASNGERHMVESYVGWPTDMVARKVLKKKILIGSEALENRSMLDLRRPLERGVIKDGSGRDEEAVRELLRHLISLIGVDDKRKSSPDLRVVIGVPSGAMQASRQRLRAAMEGIADSLMLVTEPFAVAYGADALLHALVVDIGAGTTDICIMQGRYPTEDEQRTLPDAGDAIDARLLTALQERHPEAQFSIHMVRAWKEQWGLVGEPTHRVSVTTTVEARPTPFDITREMRSACESILAPITETIVDLIARVEPEQQQKILNNIILAGGGSQISGLTEALKSSLSDLGRVRVTTIPDPVFAGSDGGLAIAQDASEDDWEKLSL